MRAQPVQLNAFFLPAGKGKLLCVCYSPVATQMPARGILFFPAFAEEMNKSRRIVAEQARAFASLGHTVLLVDWFGTGDSEGDSGEADWNTWASDVDYAMRWMQDQGIEQVCFWGMRLGALLALDSARHYPDRLNGILLWQPLSKGRNFLTQFLRLRLAADLVRAGEKITTRSLREQLDAGNSIEVAGYELSSKLAADIDELDIGELLAEYSGKLLWLEMLASEERPVPVATRKLIDELQSRRRDISFHQVICEPFWLLPELVVVPALLEASTNAFQKNLQCSA